MPETLQELESAPSLLHLGLPILFDAFGHSSVLFCNVQHVSGYHMLTVPHIGNLFTIVYHSCVLHSYYTAVCYIVTTQLCTTVVTTSLLLQLAQLCIVTAVVTDARCTLFLQHDGLPLEHLTSSAKMLLNCLSFCFRDR